MSFLENLQYRLGLYSKEERTGKTLVSVAKEKVTRKLDDATGTMIDFKETVLDQDLVDDPTKNTVYYRQTALRVFIVATLLALLIIPPFIAASILVTVKIADDVKNKVLEEYKKADKKGREKIFAEFSKSMKERDPKLSKEDIEKLFKQSLIDIGFDEKTK